MPNAQLLIIEREISKKFTIHNANLANNSQCAMLIAQFFAIVDYFIRRALMLVVFISERRM